MNKPISSGLKILFLVHFIIGVISGLINLLIPEVFLGLMNWPVNDPAVYAFLRVAGAAVLGFSIGSWFGYKATTWEQVRIVVITELVWPLLGALVTLLALVTGAFPSSAWIQFVILGGFAVAFWIYFLEHEAAATAVPAAKAAPVRAPARKVARRKRARA